MSGIQKLRSTAQHRVRHRAQCSIAARYISSSCEGKLQEDMTSVQGIGFILGSWGLELESFPFPLLFGSGSKSGHRGPSRSRSRAGVREEGNEASGRADSSRASMNCISCRSARLANDRPREPFVEPFYLIFSASLGPPRTTPIA